jgi:solute carrier family 25 carnitine/acylcarnitine transporter 20/29
LDTVKVRVQTQSKLHPIYSGSVDCFFRIIRNEGMKGLYKGLGSPMLSLTILNSISFGIYGESKRLIHKCFYNSPQSSSSSSFSRISASNNLELLPSHYSLAGAIVGVICSFISTPFEMVKVRLQLDNITERRYKGSLSCAKELTKLYGGKMLFTGFWINTVRETTFCAVYFGLYEHLKQRFTLKLNSSPFSSSTSASSSFSTSAKSPLAIFLAGGFAGMAAWFVSFPMDVIKSGR